MPRESALHRGIPWCKLPHHHSLGLLVPGLGQKGQVSNAISGTYVMSVATNETITGSGTIPLTGDFSGQFKVTFQGQESHTGELTGTLDVTGVTYMGLSLGVNIAAPGSGQFTGNAQT